MHIDLEQMEAEGDLRAQVCIVGGGIAGLLLARKLANHGCDVLLLEAGGLELEERSQSLYEAELADGIHTGTREGRFRTFGGSSTRWGGQLLPYTDDILHPVDGAPSLSWPIATNELTPHYAEILQTFGAGNLPFSNELLAALGHVSVDLGQGLRLRFSKWAPFSRRNLAQSVGKECLEHAKVRVVTHANVASLHGQGCVEWARVLDYRGREFRVLAQTFVVCCGTVESSRLLLSSPAVPNENQQVGLYFHDHVSFHAAVVPQSAMRLVTKRLGPFFVDGVLLTPKMEATSELQRDAGLLAVMAHFTVEEPEDSGIAAVRALLKSVQQGRLREVLTKNLGPMLAGVGDVGRLLWQAKVRRRRAISHRAIMRLNIDMEQPANPQRRVRLSNAVDALGLPKAVVEWSIGDAEYATAARFAQTIKARLEAAGFDAFEWLPGLSEGERPRMADTFHAMGGLRMGQDAATSVVNTDLRVHGVDNLYVASCAVFPSGGSSNPTFTMMALTLRLVEHLRASKACG